MARAVAASLQAWIEQQLAKPSSSGAWLLREPGYNAGREPGIESRLAIGNGFLGVRGARAGSRGPSWVSWLHHLNWASWPRTYVAGLFDRANLQPAVPALVPAPDWLRFRIILDGEPLALQSGTLLAHERTLDLRRGVMLAEWQQRTTAEQVVRVRSLRLVSLAERSLGMQLIVFDVDQACQMKFEAWLDVTNAGLEVVQLQPNLGVRSTAAGRQQLAIASAAGLEIDGRSIDPMPDLHLTRVWNWEATPNKTATFWRLVSFARADSPEATPAAAAARSHLMRAERASLPRILEEHRCAWMDRWMRSDIEVSGDASSQHALRYAVYHLNSAANPEDEHVSIGARALTGDAYLGHVFWDTEIYLLPFYVLTWPEAARALLMYRYHTLPAARDKAARLGYRGALYAWESAGTGEETTPESVVDPSGQIVEVLCGTLEQHISADVAYAVWQYWQCTGDVAFLLEAGAEMILSTARFWASRATLERDGRYHIRNVIGPDEYHERVDDNAYTNIMARWNLERGLELAELILDRWPEHWSGLSDFLRLDGGELAEWRRVAEGLVDGLQDDGRLEQFAGYFDLEDIDLPQYEGRAVPMDVILGRERNQASQVIKQADVVMLLALMNEQLDRRMLERNFAYYEPRCGHGSSLSRAMHALVAARLGDIQKAERYFADTAATDIEDTSAGIAGGVRIAALGGLWQVAVFGFAGLSFVEDGMQLDPLLPPKWNRLAFRFQWRQCRIRVEIERRSGCISVSLEEGDSVRVSVKGETPRLVQRSRPLRIAWNVDAQPASQP